MKTYGYLFGFIRLIKDSHHDEVFIESTQLVVMENDRWLYSDKELLAIAISLGLYNVTILNWNELLKEDMNNEQKRQKRPFC